MAFKMGSNEERKTTPAGVHDAICIGVWDLGTHDAPAAFPGPAQHRAMICWQLKSGLVEIKEYSLNVYKNPKTGIKTALANDLEGWFFPHSIFDEAGKSKFTEESFVKLPGRHCQLKTALNTKGYCKVESVHQAQDKAWEATHPTSVFQVGDSEFPSYMPAWVIKKIKECHELRGTDQSQQQPTNQGQQQQPIGGPSSEVPF
jgi:hypothetical protein